VIVLSDLEIVLFNVNEVIGRGYIGTVDAGDTIFVHMFGAYFGLAASRYDIFLNLQQYIQFDDAGNIKFLQMYRTFLSTTLVISLLTLILTASITKHTVSG
jgi:hypothetical protein